jgi:putative DNA primase/helicase
VAADPDLADLTAQFPNPGSGVFVDGKRLLVATLFEAITTTTPLAVHPSGDIWLWHGGRFVDDRLSVHRLVTSRLGDDFRNDHLNTFRTYAAATLDGDGRRLGSHVTHLVNVANGMLDPFTGELFAHDPGYLSTWQLPVAWRPDATCPRFDQWFADVLPDPDLRAALLEDLGVVLDVRGERQKKAVFLIGPTRSGKSTLARIIEAVVGAANCSAEELHDLNSNRFRAAQLYGKAMNVASDIRSDHLADVAIFKKATGGDDISAERKFNHPFTFRFRGLFLWTMNLVPTVAEAASAPYLARVRPYRFARSFLRHENPDIEAAIVATDLPGVLVRLVESLRRIDGRNGYLDNDATAAEMAWFVRQTDRLAMFLDQMTRPGDWCPRVPLYRAYERWCVELKRGEPLTRRQFYAEIEQRGYTRAGRNGPRGFKGLTLVGDFDDFDDDD